MSQQAPVKPIRLTDQVIQILKQRIFSGELRPGDRVVEQKFAREFGVGQNAIREALIELSHMGFVRRVPNKGTYVTSITREEGQKIARVRRALEGLAIELVVERMEHEKLDLQPAEQQLARMQKLLRQGDIPNFYESDIQFHRALWHLAGNEHLTRLLEQIVVPLFAFFIIVNLHPEERMDEIQEALAAHTRIMDALRSGSAEKAKARFSELLDLSVKFSPDSRPAKNVRSTARGRK